MRSSTWNVSCRSGHSVLPPDRGGPPDGVGTCLAGTVTGGDGPSKQGMAWRRGCGSVKALADRWSDPQKGERNKSSTNANGWNLMNTDV